MKYLEYSESSKYDPEEFLELLREILERNSGNNTREKPEGDG